MGTNSRACPERGASTPCDIEPPLRVMFSGCIVDPSHTTAIGVVSIKAPGASHSHLPIGMVTGTAPRKVTITLDQGRVERIRTLVDRHRRQYVGVRAARRRCHPRRCGRLAATQWTPGADGG